MRLFLTTSLLMLSILASAQPSVRVDSPDGSIGIRFRTVKGQLEYQITHKGKTLIEDSAISIVMDDTALGAEAKLGKVTRRKGVEEYSLPVGKRSHVRSEYKEATITVVNPDKSIDMHLQVKAFNDAVAFRHIIGKREGDKALNIRNEILEIRPEGNPMASALFVPGFINSHEGPYTRKRLDNLDSGKLIDMPLTLEFEDGSFAAVTEANLVDYAGMYLIKDGGKLTSRLSPRLDKPEYSVMLDSVCTTPWRVFMISDRIETLMESTVLTSLCEPCRIEDTSWLKPGKTTFPWWNDTEVPDTTFQPGNNFLTNKYYIDFAADNGLEYHSVYGYADMPWYYDDGPGFGLAGPNADLTRPVPLLDFKAICEYARSRGVDIHVWLNWAALYKNIDEIFTKFNEWGVKGMMVDFMNRDDQEMITIQENILRKAADHRLFIQFHGASKPSGLSRTYPNEFTREGTLNYEVYKWDNERQMGADHDIMMPFTRLLAGPADYHLGGFRSVPEKDYVVHYSRPLVTSTRCHMLAMYLVLESYLNMVCDYPEAYRGQPGFDFLKDVPTVWDETRVLEAKMAEYVVTARRKGKDWYVGCINNSTERTIDIDFNFLEDGEYSLELLKDSDDTDTNPNHLETSVMDVKKDDSTTVRLASSGGTVMKLSRKH